MCLCDVLCVCAMGCVFVRWVCMLWDVLSNCEMGCVFVRWVVCCAMYIVCLCDELCVCAMGCVFVRFVMSCVVCLFGWFLLHT